MSLQSEPALAELRRADPARGTAREGSNDEVDRAGHDRIPGIDEDAAAAAVTRNAAPVTLMVLAVLAAAVVTIGTWSWFAAR